ncbi:MAG: hypothetical protein ABR573_11580 [Candidatus Dormibacteria bacterium]
MRLSLEDSASLPYSCALFDRTGARRTSSPEWAGAGFGAVAYEAGMGTLVVVPDGTNTDADAVAADLLAETWAAAREMPAADRMAAEMLASALALVSGRPPAGNPGGTTETVIEYVLEGIRRSVPGVTVAVAMEVSAPIETPAAVALGLVQLARNAARHSAASRLTLRVGRGPTFRVEWEDRGGGTSVTSARRPDQRQRWGMGFTRLLADSLGGVVTAPAPVGAGRVASAIGLGAKRFSAPVAAIVSGRVERAGRAWDEETLLPPGAAPDARVRAAVDAAASCEPGEIAYSDIFRARRVGDRTWVGIAPQSSAGRVRDVLRGIQHENALLTASEPHATRVYALAAILSAGVGGEGFEPVPASTWSRDFPGVCAVLGLDPPPSLDENRLRYPDPRVAAFLLANLGGSLDDRGGGGGGTSDPPVRLVLAPGSAARPLARLLSGGQGFISLVP